MFYNILKDEYIMMFSVNNLMMIFCININLTANVSPLLLLSVQTHKPHPIPVNNGLDLITTVHVAF